MAITYSAFVEKVYRSLADVSEKQNSEELVYDAVCAAHDAILQWVPCFGVATLTSGSLGADPKSFPIPEDAYQVDVVQIVSTGAFLPKATFAPGSYRMEDQASLPYDWIEFPTGFIDVGIPVTLGDTIKVYYRAFWPKPASASDTSFRILVPYQAHLGMVYYACAHCLLPRSVQSGGIRQYNTKVDSGAPTDNPLYNMSEWFLKRFLQEMKLMPPYTKVGF